MAGVLTQETDFYSQPPSFETKFVNFKRLKPLLKKVDLKKGIIFIMSHLFFYSTYLIKYEDVGLTKCEEFASSMLTLSCKSQNAK